MHKAFDWNTIPDGHLLVDVGGGLGHVALEVTKVHPSIHVVVEDRENVLKKAKLVSAKLWSTEALKIPV